MNTILNKIKSLFITAQSNNVYKPYYRVIEVINENDDYSVKIQIINTSKFFIMKPEEILENDKLVNKFSPMDVRTLTYLGYLGINSPKYKVLAQRIADQGELIFVIKQKGSNDVILKTSKEVIEDINLLKNMSAVDVSSIAYIESQKDNL